MKLNLIAGIFFVGFIFSAHAESPRSIPGWTYLSGNDQISMYGKNGSGEISEGIRSMLVQFLPTTINEDQTVAYSKLAISDQDCKKEYGVIKLYNLNGELINNIDYVKGGLSLAVISADLLCSIGNSKN